MTLLYFRGLSRTLKDKRGLAPRPDDPKGLSRLKGGDCLEPPAPYLGKLWRLGPSWAILSHLETILGRLGAILGRLGPSWGDLGTSWTVLGAS